MWNGSHELAIEVYLIDCPFFIPGFSFGFVKKIARQNCAKNARISALGYGAVKGTEENQEAP